MTGLRPPSTPRASLGGIPTPRRKSAVPRPPSSLSSHPPVSAADLSSLQQAISAHDPASYASPTASESGTSSPFSVGVALGHGRGGSVGSATRQAVRTGSTTGSSLRSGAGSSVSRPTTPSGVAPRTPKTQSLARSSTPTGFGSSVGRFVAREPDEPALRVGTEVSFEVSGEKMEGTLRFIGEIQGKGGEWGGVELNAEWAGRGKNDGSVAGTQYFACPSACGLFLALAKITPKQNPLSTTVRAKSNPPLTAGSRAAKYAGLTAQDLTSRRTSTSTSTPSAAAKGTPRRSLSPVKPRTSISSTKRLSASVSSSSAAQTTPKPPARIASARPSFGGGAMSTPTAASRKSLGGLPTPRAASSAGIASIRRPGSSLSKYNTSSPAPAVPSIPSAYGLGLARSVTPSSGRITPSTPGAMMKRRTSLAQSETSSSAGYTRPTTPSVRSYSRQSFASSVSRQSMRSSTHGGDGGEKLAELRGDLEDARQRELELKLLLEGSEKLGREMEDRLTEKEQRARAAEERVALLELQAQRQKEDDERRLAGMEGEDGNREREQARTRELEAKLLEAETALEAARVAIDKAKLEEKHKSAAKEVEVESLRERLAQAVKEHEEEREDRNSQVDKLRTAGQALCETYEERIAEIDLERSEALDLAETLQAQLDGRTPVSSAMTTTTSDSRSTSPTNFSLSRSLNSSHASSSSAAQAIDAENALAEVAHLRTRVSTLEEQLEDARGVIEMEEGDARKRRARAGEVELLLKGEIKSLKEAIDRSAKTEARLTARIGELSEALLESQLTLEAERSELEGLRSDLSPPQNDSSLAEDLRRMQVELEKAQRNAGVVSELREDVRNAEREIERLQKLSSASLSVNGASPERKSSVGSLAGAKDEAATTRDQIVGLKAIVATLTEANQTLLERNKQLQSRFEDLGDSHKALEATVENLMAQLDSSNPPSSPPTSRTTPATSRELDQLRFELKAVQRKAELDVQALNQEVIELEALVEAKIYREGVLEQELEALRSGPQQNGNGRHAKSASMSDAGSIIGDGECEMCGGDHDLDSCPEFIGSSPTKSTFSSSSQRQLSSSEGAGEFCDDCEAYGHSLEHCPLASEIF